LLSLDKQTQTTIANFLWCLAELNLKIE